jgi:hypothetical protein
VAVVKDQGATRELLTDCRAVKRVLGAAPRGNLVRFHELRFIQVIGFSWSKQEFGDPHGPWKGQTVKPILPGPQNRSRERVEILGRIAL